MGDAADRNHFYGDAVVYDILHAPGTAAEARVLAALAREACGREGPFTFLEPACGTARHLRWLARQRHRAIGFDLAPHMIADAQRRVARADLTDLVHLFVADMTAFAGRVPRKADLAFNLVNTIRHLPSDAAMLTHFAQVSRCLKRRGAYVVGLSTSAYGAERPTRDTWIGARGRCRVVQTASYSPPESGDRTERVRSRLRVQTPAGTERRECIFTLRAYSRDEWLALLGRSCLRLDHVLDDEGTPIDPPKADYALFVLRPR